MSDTASSFSDASSSISDDSKTDSTQGQKVAVRGGAGGVAALIRTAKQQGGGLEDLGKVPVPKDVRAERCQSTAVGVNPVAKPVRMARLHSVPNDMNLSNQSNQSNGDIPSAHKIPLLPPSTAPGTVTAQGPPPKPPRTGSTSPSAFLSLDRGQELDCAFGEEGEEDINEEEEVHACGSAISFSSDEVTGEYQVAQNSPSTKRPLLPPTNKPPSETSRPGSAGSRPGSGRPPSEPRGTSPSTSNRPGSGKPAETRGTSPSASSNRPTSGKASKTRGTSPSASTNRPGSAGKHPKVPILPPVTPSSSAKTPPTPTKTTPTPSTKQSPKIPPTRPSPYVSKGGAESPSMERQASLPSRSPPTTQKTTPTSSQRSPKAPPSQIAHSGSSDVEKSDSDTGRSQSESVDTASNTSQSCSKSIDSTNQSHSKTGNTDSSTSQSRSKSSADPDLRTENELLKEQIRLLQERLQKTKASPSSEPSQQQDDEEPVIPNPLVCEDSTGRCRSRSVSPGGDEERDMFPSGDPRPAPAKPTPLPRTRGQSMSVTSSSSASPTVVSPSSVPTSVGFEPPEHPQAIAATSKGVIEGAKPKLPLLPPGSGSPVPKPRGKQQSFEKASVTSHVEATKHETKAEKDSTVPQVMQSTSSSANSQEKAKAVITLQKLLPSSSKIKTPLLPPTKPAASPVAKPVKPPSPRLEEKSSSVAKTPSPTPILAQSHSIGAVPIPKPVPPSSSTLTTTATTTTPKSWVPKSAAEQDANKPATSEVPRSLDGATTVRSPLSSSVPPPSLLTQPEPTPKTTSTHVKAPLNSVATPVATSARRAKYKKVTLTDTSWIKRKESLGNISSGSEPSTPSASTSVPGPAIPKSPSNTSVTPRPQPPTTASARAPSSGTETPPRAVPYRSHAIISGPKIVEQSYLPRTGPSPEPLRAKTAAPKVPEAPARGRTETLSVEPTGKKRFWGKTASDNTVKKPQRRHSFTRSTSNEDGASAKNNSKVKEKGGSKGMKMSQSAAVVDSPAKTPARPGYLPNKKHSDSRPISMMVDGDQKRGFTSSVTVSSMPRGVAAEEAYKQQKSKSTFGMSMIDEEPPAMVKQKKTFLSRFKNKTTVQSPAPLEEVDAQEDSSSDDEKGGTIKRMPKLRHVPSSRPDQVEDDSEPEYHQLFEYVFVVSLKEDAKKKITTEMTYTFPPTSREFSGKDEALKSIPQFCFPDIDQWKPTKSYKSESYSFVLTDMEGNRRFGYCRRLLPEGSGPRLPEVFCIVSPLGCFALYENILDHVEERRANSSLDVFNFLKAISANPFPRPGCSVQVKVFGARGSGMETLTFKRPMDSRLEHVDFSLLFNTLSQRKIIQLFSSLLMERRVIFCAKSLSLTTGCAHALMALLYPFEWQHVFIPVLPSSLIDFVCSPLPYIIGIDPASCQRLDEMETMEEALVVHLDKGKFLRKIGDETSILPSKLFQFLEGKLSSSIITSEYSKKSPVRKAAGPSKADEIVVNTFMTFFAYLYGDYSEQVKVLKSGQKEFQRADHIKKFSSKSTRRFLEALHMTQLFENFIEQRENPSKASTVAESLFEKKLPELRERCQDIEIFSSKSRFDRWKMKKDLAKGD